MFVVTPAAVVRVTPRAVQAAELAAENKGDDVDLATDRENIRRHISSYEPIYFEVGFNDGANARFQFSFKYLIIAPNNNDPEWWRSLYLGYTQTSLWELSAPSKPFYDTSYKPTVFYYHESFKVKPDWLTRLSLQAGVQHESNGKGATDSRSLNTAYVTPIAVWPMGGQWRLTVAPRFIAYADKGENVDLARYRGNVELLLRFRQDKGLQFSALLRKGNKSGYGSSQLDVTWPVRLVPGLSPNAGGYLQLQYFNGWGESLLDYNKRRPDQFRFGYTLVR
jgi:outer membrane phospholipase A